MTTLHRLAQAYVEARETRMGCTTFGLSKPVFAEACTREDRAYEALKTELAKPWREAVREEMWLKVVSRYRQAFTRVLPLLPECHEEMAKASADLAAANLYLQELTVTKEDDEG